MSASVVVAVAAYFDAVNSDVVVALQMAIVVDDVASLFGVQSTTSRPLSRFYALYSELFVAVAVAVVVVVVDAAAAVDSIDFVQILSMANYFHSN